MQPCCGRTRLLEAVDDARPWHDVSVGDVAPVRDVVQAARILTNHRIADVRKLTVLEDHKVVLLGQRRQR